MRITAVLFFLLFASTAPAQGLKDVPSPWSDAQPGEWARYQVQMTFGGGSARQISSYSVTERIRRVEGDSIELDSVLEMPPVKKTVSKGEPVARALGLFPAVGEKKMTLPSGGKGPRAFGLLSMLRRDQVEVKPIRCMIGRNQDPVEGYRIAYRLTIEFPASVPELQKKAMKVSGVDVFVYVPSLPGRGILRRTLGYALFENGRKKWKPGVTGFS